MAYQNSEVEMTLFYIHETQSALCVAETDDEADPEIWIPKTWNGTEIAYQRKGVKITIWAPEDLWVKKGLA